MRPLQLELEGFTSFKERATLDFSELDLFAVTGPTGAGKSSLVDAMIFALYGQVPRVGRVYRQLISHGAERLRVRFDFAIGGDRFRIVRTAVARGSRSQVRLERLVGEEAHPIADRARDIEREVRRIVGLDYDAFVRSVVLPQGQFDSFLKGEPEQRRRILVSLLSLGVYEEMHAIVNRRALDAKREAEFIEGQLASDFADVTPERLAALAGEVAAFDRDLSELGPGLEIVDRALAVARPLADAGQEAARLRRELRGLASRAATDEQKSDRLVARRRDIDARFEKLQCGLEKTAPDAARRARLVGLEGQLAEVVRLERRLAALRGDLGEARADSERAETQAGEASRAAKRADQALRKGERTVATHRTRRDGTLTLHAAHRVRSSLKKGEACPICGQAVASLPRRKQPRDLAEADAALHAAERELELTRAAADRARTIRDELRGTLEGHRARVEGLAAQVESDTKEATRFAASIEAVADGAASWAARLDRVRQERRQLEAALVDRDEMERERLALGRESTEAATAVASVEARRDEAARRRAELSGALERASRRERELTDDLGALLRAPQFSSGGPDPGLEAERFEALRRELEERRARVSAERARAEVERERIECGLARVSELEKRLTELRREAALSGGLAGHLKANQFIAFVLEEALRLLAEDGSRHLLTLSMGRYSLGNDDQDFCVVDHWNADRVRSVRTLSGGESFVASLSLALALAERVADLSANGRADATESLFLDEGFSTLDAESLDQVLQAIETLHQGDRVVGVVTHVSALADRLPARVEVARTQAGARLKVA